MLVAVQDYCFTQLRDISHWSSTRWFQNVMKRLRRGGARWEGAQIPCRVWNEAHAHQKISVRSFLMVGRTVAKKRFAPTSVRAEVSKPSMCTRMSDRNERLRFSRRVIQIRSLRA